ncbi:MULTISPECIES: hypothetical protein [Butyricimonas]|jgi:hypothetical protein|uniref:Outer membrane protein beta-barrel domain-containing protein n=1 Tax=Butyricimonas hominis TaxID=2763032 RepID=A0ABR7D2S1_9BACT|nr:MULTISPECIES: hypothetical protein [Butyricimonas]MBC5622062.1 hypothetical protein [Butyricimonas hominis]MCB6974813.1 hypothetical protein [Butyricimonas synergistica]MCG4521555.1 hypothetical protein [Butyricimonas sp. DFI.6.44]
MKWSIIKAGIMAVLLSFTTWAMGDEKDDREERRAERHKRKLERYQNQWNSLIPKYQNLQFAGSIGLLSAGMGWDYGRQRQWETEFMFGFVPGFSSNKTKVTLTLKQNYVPWEVSLGKNWVLEPLETGLFVNTVLASDFWVKEPEKYPNNYYKFSTRVRFHAFLGQRIALNMKENFPFRRITVYYELSTCDLYLISKFTNQYVKMVDILSLSFGLKFHIL